VESVSAPAGTFVAGARVGPPSGATAVKDGSAFLTVTSSAPLYSQASLMQLDRLQAVPGPAGQHPLLTGGAPNNRDTAHAVTSRLPIVLAIIAAITFVLLFVLTGSVVLPLKSLTLSVLSLTAAFGALVDLPGRKPRRIGYHRHRHDGGHHARAAVLHSVRVVDGL
jgi:RND superfamily putative drug exporter